MPINTYKYRYTCKGNTCEGNTYKGKYRYILPLNIMPIKVNVGLPINTVILIVPHLIVAVLGTGIAL